MTYYKFHIINIIPVIMIVARFKALKSSLFDTYNTKSTIQMVEHR